jgi:xanthine dehydrogenase YagS FAD-binding subunit
MHTFEFIRPADAAAAVAAAAQAKTAQQGADVRFVAGGTTLVDLMKLNVETPARLIDINRLPLDKIEATPDGGLKIGATVRNSDLAHHPRAQRDYPVLSQALLAGASAQLRNMATTSGNLLQRTRCMYFRDPAMPCNKREPGTGCPAITGSNRTLAVLGTSENCIATNPSDMCVAMAALEATIHVQGPKGSRAIPIGDFYLLPGSTPNRETVLEPGDLITHVTLPPPRPGSKQVYLKCVTGRRTNSPGVGGRRDHYRWRKCDSGAHCIGRRGDQPLAITRPGPLSSVSLPAQPTFARRPKRQCAAPNRRARMDLRSNWPSAACTPCKSPTS